MSATTSILTSYHVLACLAPLGLRWFKVFISNPSDRLAFATLHKSDDAALRNVFDSQPFWRDFKASNHAGKSQAKGLFENRYLTQPEGFIHLSQDTLSKCRRLVAAVVNSSTLHERRLIPRLLDRLSDSLCRVLDMADFVRATHPDHAFQRASTRAYEMLFEFMNVLNTTPDLKIQLESALADPKVQADWNNEERVVAQILLKDFSKSAIDLPEDQRKAFVGFSNQISQLGSKFVKEMRPEKPTIFLSNKQLKGVDPMVLEYASRKHLTGISIPTIGPAAVTALRSMEDESVRRDLYIAGRTARGEQLHTLHGLLQARAKVSSLSGYGSYAEMNLSDKLAKTPLAVTSFLHALSVDNRSRIRQELDHFLVLKKFDSDDKEFTTQIEAWDTDFYRTLQAHKQRSTSRRPDFMSAYFSLGTVMQGLSILFTRLYGVHFEPRPIAPGETWNDDVRRLDVLAEGQGRIAVLYCDLFARPGKSPNPAHFTLRCSRRIHPPEIEEASALHPDLDPFEVVNDGMAISHDPATNITYQLPTIALICDFQNDNSNAPQNNDKSRYDPDEPALLSFCDVQTLFHEMGHAIHSILGRTACQVVSGTRCATDFAELPSVLMEHFATDPHVLSLFARHWQTDAPLPYEMVAERLAIERKGQGIETEHQILLAMLDQAYHSDLPLSMPGGFDSTKVFHDVYDRYASVKEPRATSAQGFFGHLVEYGGTYYSYLLDRAIAGRVWQDVFDSGRNGAAVNRERGQRFKDEVLRWGGSRDGWACLAELLKDEKLRDGGPEAMAEVGRWGINDQDVNGEI
ncbi:MAG: hypothetical protein Q9174_001238 [Haloplaca sp. 1 TL-2023]